MTSVTGKELRELARKIEDEARAAPCYSACWQIVQNCSNHLQAVARVHELQAIKDDTSTL